MNNPDNIIKTWLQAVNSGNISSLLNLYNDKAILIPTFSNRILNTPEKICDYFEKLGNRKDLTVSLHKKTVNTQQINESTFTVSGIYLWQFAVEEELLSFEARFSYVLDINSERPIIHHHSSQIPRML